MTELDDAWILRERLRSLKCDDCREPLRLPEAISVQGATGTLHQLHLRCWISIQDYLRAPDAAWTSVEVFDAGGAWLYRRRVLQTEAETVARGLLKDDRASWAEVWLEEPETSGARSIRRLLQSYTREEPRKLWTKAERDHLRRQLTADYRKPRATPRKVAGLDVYEDSAPEEVVSLLRLVFNVTEREPDGGMGLARRLLTWTCDGTDPERVSRLRALLMKPAKGSTPARARKNPRLAVALRSLLVEDP